MKNPQAEYIQIRQLILLFITLLIFSGVTAFFVETGLKYLIFSSNIKGAVGIWINQVHDAVAVVNQKYPFIAYGYDWLAFGHLIIALFFIGAYKEPIKNNWVILYGMIACVAIFPTAFIAGFFREIPLVWQLIDCSFGVFGLLLLYIINRKTKRLELQLNQL
ncbi:MAG: hypothetical protein RIC95_05580 [Vicingaceae bacterium]